jgi:hypothetical protein
LRCEFVIELAADRLQLTLLQFVDLDRRPALGFTNALSGWQLRPRRGRLRGMTISPNPYRGFRFPPEVIQHAVWLYHCFTLSLRDVELILAARGIVVSYESIREWGLRFGRHFANMLKRRRPQPGDKWYMDEVFIRIRGKQHYLWHAVDQDGKSSTSWSRAGATPARPSGFSASCRKDCDTFRG